MIERALCRPLVSSPDSVRLWATVRATATTTASALVFAIMTWALLAGMALAG